MLCSSRFFCKNYFCEFNDRIFDIEYIYENVPRWKSVRSSRIILFIGLNANVKRLNF